MIQGSSCTIRGPVAVFAIALLTPLACFSQVDSDAPIKVGIIGLEFKGDVFELAHARILHAH